MAANKILLAVGILILIVIVCFYIYLNALSSAYSLHKPDKRPYYITTQPLVVKNISLPKGAKITYKERFFWEKGKQNKLLNEKDIIQITFAEGITIDWGGIPITSIVKFYNSKMKGFSVYADFDNLDINKQSQFSNLWQRCSEDLGISIENPNDWSFNKQNILDIESCGVNYQRYFKEDIEQQGFLDSLFNELKRIKD